MAKNIKYKVTDMAALRSAFPELVSEQQVTKTVVDHKRLYALVKANSGIGRGVEGVTILTGEEAAEAQDGDNTVDADAVDDAVTGNDDDAEDEDEGEDEDDK